MLVLMHSMRQPYERMHVAGQCVLPRQGKQLEGAKPQQPSLLQTNKQAELVSLPCRWR